MDLGSNSTAKLEPFLLISKSAKGAAAAKLVQDATSAPGVFVFAELLDLPNIQELAHNEQHSKFYSLLQLFAYKTYKDYIQYKDELPPLNQAQITKLKHLTLVSLSQDRRILPYPQLLEELQTPTIRELEDLIIEAIYQDVIRGKLDQNQQQFEVEYTMGRDLEPGKVESLLTALQNWASTTSAVLATLDNKLTTLTTQAAKDKTAKEAYDKQYRINLTEVQDKQREAKLNAARPVGPVQKSGMTDAGRAEREKELQREREKEARGESMDVDEPEARAKNRKGPFQEVLRTAKRRNRF